MADLNIALILRLVDKATAPARTALRQIERIGGDGMMRQAERVTRGARLMKSGMQDVTRSALQGGAVVAAYGTAVTALAASFIRPAAQFENFRVQLTNLEGSSEGAERAMKWIETFATKTPLQMDQTVAAYARLKAFGIDPTNGSMQALVDTMAATGGGVEVMDGLVLALGQSWTKGKLQGEEAMQMLERGVPVWDLLAKKMGKTTAEVIKMSEKGQLGREQITLLMEAMGEANAGASEKMSETWDGIMSNLLDQWGRFQRLVMDSGVFKYMKGELQALLDELNAMAEDGRLQAYAEQLGATILDTLRAIRALVGGVISAFEWLAPKISYVADLLNGWENMAWLAVAILMRATVFGLIGGFAKLAFGAVELGLGLFGMAGQAVLGESRMVRLGRALSGPLSAGFKAAGNAIQWLGRIMLIVGRAMLANPIFLALALIAGAAYVIYQNWDGITAYFDGKISRIRDAFDKGLINGVFATLSELNPFTQMYDAADGLLEYLTGWDFADVGKMMKDTLGINPFEIPKFYADQFRNMLQGWSWSDVTAALTSAFDINLYDLGVKMMQSLWEGIKSIVAQIGAWMVEQTTGWMPSWAVGGTGAPAGAPNRAVAYSQAAGSGAGGASGTWGGKATGGPVRAGMIYRWLEEGDEMFSPTVDGSVISNREVKALRRAGSGGGGGGMTIGGITINALPGQSPQAIAREVRRQLEALARGQKLALHDGGEF